MEHDFYQNNSYNLFKTVNELEHIPKKRPCTKSFTNIEKNIQISTKFSNVGKSTFNNI